MRKLLLVAIAVLVLSGCASEDSRLDYNYLVESKKYAKVIEIPTVYSSYICIDHDDNVLYVETKYALCSSVSKEVLIPGLTPKKDKEQVAITAVIESKRNQYGRNIYNSEKI